jgi:hypothetical protein
MSREGHLQQALSGPFCLERRTGPARTLSYQCRDVYVTVDQAGQAIRRELHSAHMTETIPGAPAHPETAPWPARWVFTDMVYELTEPGAASEPDALAAVLSVEGSAEDPDAYIGPLGTLDVPRTPRGWLAAEQVIHARMPEIVTSRQHGAIHKLRRPGDRVQMPWSDEELTASLPGVIEVRLRRGRCELCFDGLSLAGRQPVALLSFTCPLEFLSIAGGRGTGHLAGHIGLSLRTGDVVWAAWKQTNYLSIPLDHASPGLSPLNQIVEGTIQGEDSGGDS